MASLALGVDSGARSDVSTLEKMYTWSIILEPMLFFNLVERTVSGVSGNLSRILQILVMAGLVLRFVYRSRGNIPSVRISHPLYRDYRNYIGISIAAGLLGLVSGAYDLPAYGAEEASAIASFLNSASIRPIFEYIIAIYYFVYFAILPQWLLRTPAHIDYAFGVFTRLFMISFVLGFVDLAASAANHPFLPRMVSDGIFNSRYVGVRYHGLAGEPRDAFVYLFLGLAIFHLMAFYRGGRVPRWFVLAVIGAALLTQSASGLLGVGMFVGLYAIYTVPDMSLTRIFQLVAITLVAVGTGIFAVTHTDRLMLYVRSAQGLWDLLDRGETLPEVIRVQMANIYPIYDLTVKLRHGDLPSIFLGSGFGSASAANNRFAANGSGMDNPHSQFVRVIYESGLAGLYFFIRAFVTPVRLMSGRLPKRERNEFLIFALLLIGCSLGHRSSAPFLYLGLLIAVGRRMHESGRLQPAGLPALLSRRGMSDVH